MAQHIEKSSWYLWIQLKIFLAVKDSITDEKNIRNGLHKSILHTFNELLFFLFEVSLDCIAFFERFGNTRSQKHETCLHSKQNSNKSRKVPTIIQILAIRQNRLFEFTLSSNRTSHSALFVDFHRCFHSNIFICDSFSRMLDFNVNVARGFKYEIKVQTKHE